MSAAYGGVGVVLQLTDDPPVARQTLLAEVAVMTGIEERQIRLVHCCPRCGSPAHGRPLVLLPGGTPAPSVSLSRSDGLVCVAVSWAGPVGVDVERLDAGRFAGVADVVRHRDETPTDVALTWVRKESVLKATGDGLAVDPAQVRVDVSQGEPRLLAWPGQRVPVAQLHDLRIPGYAACVTVLGPQRSRISLRQEAPAARSVAARHRTVR